MEQPSTSLTPGCLLISQPEAGDPRFEMSVSMLCEHDENGSFALILNKPTDIYLNISDFLVAETKETELHYPLWMGGPVQMDQCFFIYKSQKDLGDSKRFFKDLYLSSSPKVLKELIYLDDIQFKIFIGYAGWSYYQLDCEISYGWWLMQNGNEASPFHPKPQQQWLESLKEMGDDLYQKGQKFINSDQTNS